MNNNTCRICFGEETDDDELGRLFSPCKCKGTMKYVHVNCLEQWRRSSGVNKSFYECGQCKYKYNLSRLTLAASIANEGI